MKVSNVLFEKIKPEDTALIQLIADWYLKEWHIPAGTTIQKLSIPATEAVPFQIIMSIDNVPIATGGLYYHVALLDREPKFNIYGPWLALVYTTTENRNKGYGALLCEKIEDVAKDLGLKEIFLFTHTAESLYTRLGWTPFERLAIKDRNIVVMKKELEPM